MIGIGDSFFRKMSVLSCIFRGTDFFLSLKNQKAKLEYSYRRGVVSIERLEKGEIRVDALSLVMLLAVVVEKVVELFKTLVYSIPFLQDKFRPLTLELISLGTGILLAYETQINALELIGIQTKDVLVGVIITGLVIGKGSNFAHDFFHYVNNKQKNGGA